jgi:hypothetical protein
MHRPPTQGIIGAKPRLPKTEANGLLASKEELARLSEEYLRTRNMQMASKAAIAEMELHRRRGELIDKKWAFASLSYILVCFRQRVLLAPAAIAQQLVTLGLVDSEKAHATSEAIRKDIHNLLTELANLPDKVTNPNWLAELERENVGATSSAERKQTPKQARDPQAKAVRLRERKTETMRRLRAEGRA